MRIIGLMWDGVVRVNELIRRRELFPSCVPHGKLPKISPFISAAIKIIARGDCTTWLYSVHSYASIFIHQIFVCSKAYHAKDEKSTNNIKEGCHKLLHLFQNNKLSAFDIDREWIQNPHYWYYSFSACSYRSHQRKLHKNPANEKVVFIQ